MITLNHYYKKSLASLLTEVDKQPPSVQKYHTIFSGGQLIYEHYYTKF